MDIEKIALGPYPAFVLCLVYCSLLLKANKELLNDVKTAFKETIDMFSRELENCQKDRESMFKELSDIKREMGKQ